MIFNRSAIVNGVLRSSVWHVGKHVSQCDRRHSIAKEVPKNRFHSIITSTKVGRSSATRAKMMYEELYSSVPVAKA